MAILESITQNKQIENSNDSSTLSGRESLFINLINKNPGIRYLELKSLTGLSNGVVSYYLRQLESDGYVKSVRTPRVSFFTLYLYLNYLKKFLDALDKLLQKEFFWR